MRFSSVKQFCRTIICNFEPNHRKPISDFWHHGFANIRQPLIFIKFDHSYCKAQWQWHFHSWPQNLISRFSHCKGCTSNRNWEVATNSLVEVTCILNMTLPIEQRFGTCRTPFTSYGSLIENWSIHQDWSMRTLIVVIVTTCFVLLKFSHIDGCPSDGKPRPPCTGRCKLSRRR